MLVMMIVWMVEFLDCFHTCNYIYASCMLLMLFFYVTMVVLFYFISRLCFLYLLFSSHSFYNVNPFTMPLIQCNHLHLITATLNGFYFLYLYAQPLSK